MYKLYKWASICCAAVVLFATNLNAQDVDFAINSPMEDILCVGEEYEFNAEIFNYTTDAITGVLWNFGDGENSGNMPHYKAFTVAGTYEVQLTLVADSGTPIMKSRVFTVEEGGCGQSSDNVYAGMIDGPTDACAGDPLTYSASSFSDGMANIEYEYWVIHDDMGTPIDYVYATNIDGYVLENVGMYYFEKIVEDTTLGLTDNNALEVYINDCANQDPADFDWAGSCENIDFWIKSPAPNATNYVWSFGDGTPNEQGNGLTSVSHYYSNDGEYDVMVQVFDSANNEISSMMHFVQVNCGGAEMTVYVNHMYGNCAGEEFGFDAEVMGGVAPYSFNWDIMGNSFSDQSLYYNFQEPGEFNIYLTVEDANGEMTGYDQMVYVEECGANGELGQFQFYGVDACSEDSMQFMAMGDVKAASSFSWDFNEDGTADAMGENVKWRFPSSGDYNVTLEVMDTLGQTFSSTEYVYQDTCMPPNPAEFYYSNSCIEKPVTFMPSNQWEYDYTSYQWSVDGNIAGTDSTLNYDFTAPGQYMVELVVELNGGELHEMTSEVYVQECPPIQIDQPCLGYETYIGWSPMLEEHYLDVMGIQWMIDGNTVATEESFQWQFNDTGMVSIVAVVMHKDSMGQDVSSTFTRDIHVHDCDNNEPPYIQVYGQCVENIYHFEIWNYSGGEITWGFANLTETYVGESFDHQFAEPGEYQVYAFSNGTEISQTYVYVSESCEGNGGGIDFNHSEACVTEPTYFEFYHDGSVSEVFWNFGPGADAVGFNVDHQFTQGGDQEVKVMYVTTSQDTFGLERMIYVYDECNGNGGGDTQALYYSNTCNGLEVEWYLNPELGVNPDDYTWVFDFGNGQTSTDYPAVVTYDAPGEYFTIAFVTEISSGDMDTLYQDAWIDSCDNNGGGFVDGDFEWYNDCAGENIEIFYKGQDFDPNAAAWTWMVNGETITGHPGSFMLEEGNYMINVQADDGNGGNLDYSIEVFVHDCDNNGGGGGAPEIIWDQNCIGQPTAISLKVEDDDSFDPSQFDWEWTIGDQTSTEYPAIFTFDEPGAYNGYVKAIGNTPEDEGGELPFVFFAEDCNNQSGAGDVYNFFVEQPCKEEPSLLIVQGPLTKLANIVIDFGDGSATVEGASATHQYTEGSYTASATLTTIKGDTTLFASFDVAACFVEVPDVVDVSFSQNGDCAKEEVVFETSTNATDAIAFVNWHFGDGKVGQGMNAAHVYPAAGTYNVKAVYGDFNGNVDSSEYALTIVDCPDMGAADFEASPDNCIDVPVTFMNLSTYPNVAQYRWTFGDGTESFKGNPSHVFKTAKDYTVELEVTTVKGNVYTQSKVITVGSCTDVDAAFDIEGSCLDSVINFVDMSFLTNATGASWTWDFGDGNVSTTQNATHTYASIGTYDVTLTVQDSAGVSSTLEGKVVIFDCDDAAVELQAFSKSVSCFGECDGSATVIAGGSAPFTYAWDNGATTAKISGVCAGTYTVEVTSKNGNTATTSVTVDEPAELAPVISATDQTLCKGEFAVLNVGAGYASYDWNTGDDSEVITVDEQGQYSVIVSDGNGCTAKADIAIQVNEISQVLVVAKPAVCLGDTSTMVASNVKSVIWGGGLGINKKVYTTPSKTKTYTVKGIDENGCVSTASVTVGVNPLPKIAFTIDDADCGNASGNVTTVVTGGTSPYSYQWKSGETTADRSNLAAGTYYLAVVDSNGCKAKKVAAIKDIDGPTVSVAAGLGSNCGGPDGTAEVTVSGGQPPYAYEWTNGSTDAELANVPADAYGVKVTDSEGCIGSGEVEIAKVGDNPPSIIGHIASSANGFNIKGGTVKIFRNHGGKGKFSVVAESEIDESGNFNIPSILPIGEYYMVAKPDTSIDGQKFQIPSYFQTIGDSITTTHKWLDASTHLAACDSMLEVDIKIIDLAPLDGTSNLRGTLFDELSGLIGKKSGVAGEPIPGITVSLEQVPGGIVAQTTTDEDGNYQFDNVPEGDYTIHVDVPGLEMEQSYDLDLVTSDTSVVDLDFIVTEEVITIEAQDTKVEVIEANNAKVAMYPNPFKESATIAYDLKEAQEVSIRIFNLLGEQVFQQAAIMQSEGVHQVVVNTQDLGDQTGIYLVKMAVGDQTITQRLITTR